MGRPGRLDAATAATWRAEPRSRVAFDVEDVGNGVVKLTVTHDGFAPGSTVLANISQGWPAVLSSLKTLLETGSGLPTALSAATRRGTAAQWGSRPVVRAVTLEGPGAVLVVPGPAESLTTPPIETNSVTPTCPSAFSCPGSRP